MDKTSEKVTKDPKRVEAAPKDREKNMDKLNESILNDAKKVAERLPIQAMKPLALLPMQIMKLPALPTMQSPEDQMELIFIALVYLLFLLLAFAYFLHIKLLELQTKNKSMKNKINHQNDVICFRYYDEKNLNNK